MLFALKPWSGSAMHRPPFMLCTLARERLCARIPSQRETEEASVIALIVLLVIVIDLSLLLPILPLDAVFVMIKQNKSLDDARSAPSDDSLTIRS
jgi:hypothetical protein